MALASSQYISKLLADYNTFSLPVRAYMCKEKSIALMLECSRMFGICFVFVFYVNLRSNVKKRGLNLPDSDNGQ